MNDQAPALSPLEIEGHNNRWGEGKWMQHLCGENGMPEQWVVHHIDYHKPTLSGGDSLVPPRRGDPVKMQQWLVQRIFFTMHQGGLTHQQCRDAVDEAARLYREATQ